MGTLNIDNGLNEYDLGNGAIVHFNPGDATFLAKIYDTFEAAEEREKGYRSKLSHAKSDGREILDLMREEDAAMRQLVDGVFDVPVCDKVFGTVNLLAPCTNGIPAWANLFYVIIDQCYADVDAAQAKARRHIEKYTKKYLKK